jgi:hypothetical protein
VFVRRFKRTNLIGHLLNNKQKIAADVNGDQMETNAQNDTNSVNETVCEPNESVLS